MPGLLHQQQRLARLGEGVGHDGALAAGQAVGLEHQREAGLGQVGAQLLGGLRHLVGGRGDAVADHEGARPGLARLQPRRAARVGPTMGRPDRAELVHDAERQRQLRPDEVRVDLLLEGPLGKRLDAVSLSAARVRFSASSACRGCRARNRCARTCGLRARASTRACSRAPLPITSTRITLRTPSQHLAWGRSHVTAPPPPVGASPSHRGGPMSPPGRPPVQPLLRAGGCPADCAGYAGCRGGPP